MTKIDILNAVRERFDRNQNWLCIEVGDTGSGKSWTGLKIGSELDDNFSVDNVAFDVPELINLIEILPPRSFILVDEAGVSYGARNFMSVDNVMISKVLQAFRFKRYGLMFTLPDTHQIDVNAKRLLHNYMETLPIDYTHGLTRVKWFDIRVDRWKGEVYQKYPRIRTSSGVKVVTQVKFGKPPEDLIKAYEEKKQKAFQELIQSCKRAFSGESRKQRGGQQRETKSVVEQPSKPLKFYQETRIVDSDEIEVEIL